MPRYTLYLYDQSEWWRRQRLLPQARGDVCRGTARQHCHAASPAILHRHCSRHGAEVEIAATQGRRRMPLSDLYVEDGCKHLTLSDDELVVAAYLPPDPPSSAYSKVRVRGAIDYPLAGVAVALGINDGIVRSLSIGLTGTNSWPGAVRTDTMVGRPIDDKALQTSTLVQKQVQPCATIHRLTTVGLPPLRWHAA
jgi:4-hydroxybenzoyl-CoA reductase subunit beta